MAGLQGGYDLSIKDELTQELEKCVATTVMICVENVPTLAAQGCPVEIDVVVPRVVLADEDVALTAEVFFKDGAYRVVASQNAPVRLIIIHSFIQEETEQRSARLLPSDIDLDALAASGFNVTIMQVLETFEFVQLTDNTSRLNDMPFLFEIASNFP